jgi:hypothetical protein
MHHRPKDPIETLSVAHGVFNAVTGLWPVVHRKSFEAVTGRKVDFWLVRTVGLLLGTTGVAMTLAGFRRRVTPEIRVIGIGVPGALAAIDVVYGSTGRISRIYLVDAVLQAGIVAGWIAMSRSERVENVLPADTPKLQERVR